MAQHITQLIELHNIIGALAKHEEGGRDRKQVGHFFTKLTHGNGTVGMHPDAGLFPDEGKLLFQMRFGIRHRGKVWHGAHIGIPAVGRCQRTGFHGFFIRKTRFSEMHMHITETGKNNMSTGKGNSFTAAGIKKQCGGFLGPGHLAHCPAHCFHLRICIIKALFSGKAGIAFCGRLLICHRSLYHIYI